MARVFHAAVWLGCVFGCALSAQKLPQPAPPEPPEEDELIAPRQYALNPVQAKKEITAGDYYFKKPNYNAAARRYLEATRWDPGSAEAFRKLGEAHEKLGEFGRAREAYLKYIELAGDPKEADALRKKIAKWPVTPPKTLAPPKTPSKNDR